MKTCGVCSSSPLNPARLVTMVGIVGVVMGGSLGACGVRPMSPYSGLRVDPGSLVNPFAPVSMEIHPLTRVDRDGRGNLWIICHIELRDAWGESTKGAGDLQIQLYRPVGARVTTHGVQELTWDVDLSDMEVNATHYDAATRTYRLPLSEPPEWIGEATEAGHARGLLRAVLTTSGPQGEELVLEHEFQLQ